MSGPTAVELEILRRMTPAQKLRSVDALLRSAWALTEAGIVLRTPGLSAEALAASTREAFCRDVA